MDCKKTVIDQQNSFIERYTNHNTEIINFYGYKPGDQSEFEKRSNLSANGREEALSKVIFNYMSQLNLTDKQHENIENLKHGHKVIIGGQQAGLFTGPLYTFHKIISIIVLANEQSEKLNTPVIPVFWIAGEDHDFDEVNHTYAYDRISRQLNKVKYSTLEPPEKSVSHYHFDKALIKDALNDMFSSIGETVHSKDILLLIPPLFSSSSFFFFFFIFIPFEVFPE
ncbi:bacillithiol biosynthesis protein BshC [Mammaliicoccus sciuri]|uniref:bacillithiol biosynthesis protein BshC n=1 Tax=Mammaliicoccus sciuri TaxID=1296 RepID=UPI002270AC5D|nr:bacillithiol biosynthesis BshC [Mammaliicoccus sciuri]MCY1050077.1 bacillithiol biosynthesis BshC [Mammaliicoccus sciuri]